MIVSSLQFRLPSDLAQLVHTYSTIRVLRTTAEAGRWYDRFDGEEAVGEETPPGASFAAAENDVCIVDADDVRDAVDMDVELDLPAAAEPKRTEPLRGM